MSTSEIFEKIRLIPENYQQEVVDFIDFILKKSKKTVYFLKSKAFGFIERKDEDERLL